MPIKTITLLPGELSLVRELLVEALGTYQMGKQVFPSDDPHSFHKLMAEMTEDLIKKIDDTPEDVIPPIMCGVCQRDHDKLGHYMVTNEVWAEAGLDPKDFVCSECLAARLGRPLDFDKDYTLCALNFFWVAGFDRKERMRRNMLQDGTDPESPVFKKILSMYDEDGNRKSPVF